MTKAQIATRAGQVGISLEPETPEIPAGLSPAQRAGLAAVDAGQASYRYSYVHGMAVSTFAALKRRGLIKVVGDDYRNQQIVRTTA